MKEAESTAKTESNGPCQLWKDLEKYGEKKCSRLHAEGLKLSGYPQGVSYFYYDKDADGEWQSYLRPRYAVKTSEHCVDAPTIDEMILYISQRLKNPQTVEKKQQVSNILAQAVWTILRHKLLP